MTEEDTAKLSAIRRVYQNGLALFQSTGLYGAAPRVPKSGEPDFTSRSFEEYVRQSWQPQRYDAWWLELKNCFADNRLNYLRFEKKIMHVDPKKHSALPAAKFIRALDEVEEIATNTAHFHSYILMDRPAIEWHEIVYSNGTVAQGLKSHSFTNEACIRLLNRLWEQREIQRPDKSIARAGTPLAWSDGALKSERDVKATAQAVNKSMREKDISLRVTYPAKAAGVVLVVIQEAK